LTTAGRTARSAKAQTSAAPLWAGTASLLLAVPGLMVSAYLTFEHYSSGATLACPEAGVVNCVKVTTSSYASLVGVPVALLGLGFFAVMTVLCSPWGWRARSRWAGRARLTAAVAGVVMVLYLVWVELIRIDAICLWCTVVHALTFALFAVLVVAAALTPVEPS
jgi:uncharacterized membrane protein